ncbi:MAG: hypothetical protein AAGK04_04255 [Planctomycetota bacterium]
MARDQHPSTPKRLSKPWHHQHLAFLRTPLTLLVLAPLLAWQARWLQAHDREGLVAGVVAFVTLAPHDHYARRNKPAIERALVITNKQGDTCVWWVNQRGQAESQAPTPDERVVALLTLRVHESSIGLWARELFTRHGDLYVDTHDNAPIARHQVSAWFDRWKRELHPKHDFRRADVYTIPTRARRNATPFRVTQTGLNATNAAISMVALLALAAMLYALATIPEWRPRALRKLEKLYALERYRTRHGHCTHCGYDLNDLDTPRCPECGKRQNDTGEVE